MHLGCRSTFGKRKNTPTQEIRVVARTIIGGGGCIFIYSCSARRNSSRHMLSTRGLERYMNVIWLYRVDGSLLLRTGSLVRLKPAHLRKFPNCLRQMALSMPSGLEISDIIIKNSASICSRNTKISPKNSA
jgi:hypothetical protein